MTVSTYVLTNGSDTIVTYPYSIGQMVAAHPTVSFPSPVPDEIAADYNTFPVIDTPQPSYDYMTQNLNLIDPVKNNTDWVQQWSVTTATPEEQATRLAAWRANTSCTPLQGKIELNNENLLTQAESAVAAADKNTQLAWANAIIWYRTSPMIETLGTQLGLTPTDLDNLFKAAQKITV